MRCKQGRCVPSRRGTAGLMDLCPRSPHRGSAAAGKPGGPRSGQAFCTPDSVESTGDASGRDGQRARPGHDSETSSQPRTRSNFPPLGDPALGWTLGGSGHPALLPPVTWEPSAAEKCRRLDFDIIIVYSK